MNRCDAAIGSCLVLALAASLAGCHDPSVGKIHADRRVLEQVERGNLDRQPQPSKSSRNRPDTNDLSPKFRSGEAQK